MFSPQVVCIAAIGIASILPACSQPRAAFQCGASSECSPNGQCEDSGFCSFPDGNCSSGRRYGAASGAGYAQECVEASGLDAGMCGDQVCGLGEDCESCFEDCYECPLLHWPFDTDAGDIRAGWQGRAHEVTFVSGGVRAGAASFPTATSDITVELGPLTADTGTLTLWYQPSSESGAAAAVRSLFLLGESTNSPGSFHFVHNASLDNLLIGHRGITENVSFSTVLAADTWRFFAYTWDGATGAKALYIDGTSVATVMGTVDDESLGTEQYMAFIGNSDRLDTSSRGLIDDVRLYERSLLSSEIAKIFASYPTP